MEEMPSFLVVPKNKFSLLLFIVSIAFSVGGFFVVHKQMSNKIAEQDKKIAEQGKELTEQGKELADQAIKIIERDDKIASLDKEVAGCFSWLKDYDGFMKSMEKLVASYKRYNLKMGKKPQRDVSSSEKKKIKTNSPFH